MFEIHWKVAAIQGFLVAEIAILLTTLYLHRFLAHNALKMHRIVVEPTRFVLWITTGQKPREWAAVHRKHHAATDSVDDPHSPVILGAWRVELTNAALYRRAARDPTTMEKYGQNLPSDNLDKWFYDRAFLGLFVGIMILVIGNWLLGFGPLTGLLAAGIHTLLYLGLAGAINSLCHTRGKRPYQGSATNRRWFAFFTWGEALHSNHHAAPTTASMRHRKGEWDPAMWVVKALEWLHLAKVRHEEVHLKPVR